jgi:ribosomal protein S18 acetylase RimI-like enzyme
VTPMSPRGAVGVSTITACIEQLRSQGYQTVLTSALSLAEQQPFLDSGFTVTRTLHLLACDLSTVTPPGHQPLRRGRRSDRDPAITVDSAAFNEFWRLDRRGLDDAVSATPASRFRVSKGAVVAYAVSGRAGPMGYLQRLAVHPEHQHHGLGRVLASDALWWMRRRGARRALVNTQPDNAAALALYESLGFTCQPHGLAVLDRQLDGA